MLKTDINIRSGFKYYKKNKEQTVDEKNYVKINNAFNQFIIDKVFDGYDVVLPARMGILSIVGKKKKLSFNEDGTPRLPPDWKKTKKLWDKNPEAKKNKKLVYITNEHTDGIIYSFFWSKLRMLVAYKSVYSLRMVRGNKRRVWREVLNGKEFSLKY